MPLTRQKKESILKELSEQLKKTQAVIFVNFHGLGAVATRKLRLAVKAAGKYQVVKKTLIKIALEKFGIPETPELKGEVALIFGSEDKITDIAKGLVKFIREHKELSVLGGIFEKKFIGPKLVSELAAIPSREALLAKLVNVINSPVQRLVVTLNSPMRNFVKLINDLRCR